MLYIPVSPAIGGSHHHYHTRGRNIVRRRPRKPYYFPIFPFRQQVIRPTYGLKLPLSDSFGLLLDDWETQFDCMQGTRKRCCECQSQIPRNETEKSLSRLIPVERVKDKTIESLGDSWNEADVIEGRAYRKKRKHNDATELLPALAFNSIFDDFFDLRSNNDDTDPNELTAPPPLKSKFIGQHNQKIKTQGQNGQNKELNDESSSKITFRKINGNAIKSNAASSPPKGTGRNVGKTKVSQKKADEEKDMKEERREIETTTAEKVKRSEKRVGGSDDSNDNLKTSSANNKPEESNFVVVPEAKLLDSFDSSSQTFKIDMPITGFSLDDVVIQCDDKRRRLTVSAEREDVDVDNGCVSSRMQKRSFQFPEDVDVDSISSQITADSDVLTIFAERKRNDKQFVTQKS